MALCDSDLCTVSGLLLSLVFFGFFSIDLGRLLWPVFRSLGAGLSVLPVSEPLRFLLCSALISASSFSAWSLAVVTESI